NRPESSGSDTFARLVAELQELGFERSPTPPLPDRAVYTATDSPVTFTIAAEPPEPHVHVGGARDGHGWHPYWTAATPDVVAPGSLSACGGPGAHSAAAKTTGQPSRCAFSSPPPKSEADHGTNHPRPAAGPVTTPVAGRGLRLLLSQPPRRRRQRHPVAAAV